MRDELPEYALDIAEHMQLALDRAGVDQDASELLGMVDLRVYARDGCSASWLVSRTVLGSHVMVAHVYAPLRLHGALAEWFWARLEADMLEVGATQVAWIGRGSWPRFFRRWKNGRSAGERSQ